MAVSLQKGSHLQLLDMMRMKKVHPMKEEEAEEGLLYRNNGQVLSAYLMIIYKA